jgi:hypothetical protein
MKDTIYKTIQENNKIGFDDLFKACTTLTTSKQELGLILRELEADKSIFQYNNQYHDLNAYPDIEGYAQWGINGFCWLDTTNNANEFGISYDLAENLTTIYNKRDTFYGAYIHGKSITDGDRNFVIVTQSEPTMDLKVIATFDELKKQWIILNGNTTFNFPETDTHFKNGEINIFNFSAANKTYLMESKLGNKEDYGIESKIIEILCEIKTAPNSDFIEPAKCAKKLNKPFYTIDSIYTSDVDDAIHIEAKEDGYKLYVAIADVSSYVLPGDIQDQHAAKSCTSFYLPHHVTHMLDRKLAEQYCSLNVGETKTALVCEMDFNSLGEMQSKEFYQSEITVSSRLSYDDVDRIISGQNPQESFILKNNLVEKFNNLDQDKNLINSLAVLEKFSQLNDRHQERNYFIVENPEYHLGENGKVDYLYLKEENAISQKMVESAMLSANIAAAEYIHENYSDLESLEKSGMFRNQSAPIGQDKPKPASYGFVNSGHWGLQTEFYTHFTSPIRRYCDLIVHRLIKGIILENVKTYSNEELHDISQQINLQQYKAKQCSVKAKNLLVPQYLEELVKTGQLDTKLEIVDFSANGLVCRNKQYVDIFIPSFKLESYVTRVLNKLLPTDGSELPLEKKIEGVEQLNKTWEVFMQLGMFSWTDERKNAFYQFQKKQPVYKNNL